MTTPSRIPARRKNPEEQLQRAVAELLGRILPPGVWWTAINPIPAKSKAAAGISKAMGMKAGVPDLLIIHRGKAHFIELKAPKGRLSVDQTALIMAFQTLQIPAAICRSQEEVIGTLRGWQIPMLNARVAA